MGKTTDKKSTTGTKCTKVSVKKELPKARRARTHNYSDLAKLLVAAGESGVESLEIGDIKVKFHSHMPTEGRVEAQALLSEAGSDALLSASDTPLQEVITSPEHRARLEELEQEQLMLDDPLAFETSNIDRLMGNGLHA